MHHGTWLRALIAGSVTAALLAAPSLPLPFADRAGFGGEARAQGYLDIGSFYDELDPYGQWAWHPRFGYVWLPETVSPYWRPYTVGNWVYTDEYGWYWNSYEPFAWAVYHYGRWGYDPAYGWFWVPGDVWAPAWVQWRYSDNYVGWAPIGPGRQGYAYGMPASYDPPIAESWVFVQPRYLTSRAITQYALPVGALGPAFFSATAVYRPEFRRGVVYNYGMPRDRVMKIIKRPIVVEKVYRFDRKDKWQGGGPGKGIKIYAPGFARGDRPQRPPKRFVDNPNAFKPKARLQDTYRGDVPKGWGRSAKGMVSITKEAGPDAWKKKQWGGGHDAGPGRGNDKWQPKDTGKEEAARDRFDVPPDPGNAVGRGAGGGEPGGPGGPSFRQGDRDQQKPKKNKQQFGTPGGPGGAGAPGGFDGRVPPKQFDQFDQGDAGGNNRKGGQQFGRPGNPGGPGGPGSPGGGFEGRTAPQQIDEFDQGNAGGKNRKGKQQFGGPGMPDEAGRAQNGGDGGDGGGKNKKKQAKCERNPDHPGCQ